MKFIPMTKEQIELANLLEPGIYPFQVLAASDEISKAGNEMIKIKLAVFSDDREVHVYDYLMEKMAFKLRHFAEFTGQLAAYEHGMLDAMMVMGKVGYCKVDVEKGDGMYPPKNTIRDYVAKPGDSVTPAPAPEVPRQLKPEEFANKHGIDLKATLDDDIPF